MKTIYGIVLVFISLFAFNKGIQAQTPCVGITVGTFSTTADPNMDYYGIYVSLDQPYDQDISVSVSFYPEGRPWVNSTSVTVPAGEVSVEGPQNIAVPHGTSVFTENPIVSPPNVTKDGVTYSTQCSISGGGTVQFTMNPDLQNFINQKQQELNNSGNNICSQVDALSADVTPAGNGTLTYPNYVRFVEIGQAIEALNGSWDDLYANAMNEIINYAFASGAATGENNEQNKETVWDIIEEQHFIIAEEKASLCFEQKFGFNSLRKQVSDQENVWLETGNGDMSQNPFLNQDLPEEYWTLVTPTYGVSITDVDVSNQLTPNQEPDRQKAKELLARIKEIVEIMSLVIQGIQALSDLLQDCGSTTEAHVRRIRDGFITADQKRKIGYEMEQRSVTFDFHSTNTKIKGKAKLYKIKSNGGQKKDRKSTVGIAFCAKEWNICDGREWPSDAGSYESPITPPKRKKVKIEHLVGYALGIEKSYHFVRFKFYALENHEKSLNLLGTTGCN